MGANHGPKAKENEEIRGLLNAGHRRGAVAGRCVVHGKQVMTEEISAYCAVALAGLGWLPDTILSRSVIIRMRRRGPGEKVMAYRRWVHAPFGQTLRECLVAWAAGEVEAMADARPEMPPGIEDRDADVWEPLLAIADAVGGDWPVRARGAAVALVGAAREIEPSLGIRLLTDLKTIFDSSTLTAIATATILSRLVDLPESPWGDLKGRQINDRILARRLRQYGVKSKKLRVGDTTAMGYAREDLADVWLRYLPLSPTEAEQAEQAEQGPKNGDFSCSGYDHVPDSKRNTPSERNGKSSIGSSIVPDVPDVPLVRGNWGRGPWRRSRHPRLPRSGQPQGAIRSTACARPRRRQLGRPAVATRGGEDGRTRCRMRGDGDAKRAAPGAGDTHRGLAFLFGGTLGGTLLTS